MFKCVNGYFMASMELHTTYKTIRLINVIELAAYFVYSYFGPTVEYNFRLFVPRCRATDEVVDWQNTIIDLVWNTNLAQRLITLSTERASLEEEMHKFLVVNN